MAGVMARDELSESCFMRCDHDDGGLFWQRFLEIWQIEGG